MERRLAAILAADVVGFSRLIGADEAGTLRALKQIRADVIDGKIAEHHGRIVKLTGDGSRGIRQRRQRGRLCVRDPTRHAST